MVLPQLIMAGKLGLKALPILGAVSGAQQGLRRGNLGEAALGAGFGALTGASGVGATNDNLIFLSIFFLALWLNLSN